MPTLSKNSNSSARLSADSAEAERRLLEAEERLREAIEELQRRQRTVASGDDPPCDHADDSCVANAIGNLCQTFLLSYGVRAGIGILLRAFKLARGQSYSSLLDLKAVICMHRKIASKDHKLVYWVAGGLSALSVLLEKKARRSELALYVLPRAGESLWYILVNRRLLPDVKNAEVALFCACMGGIMYYLEYEPDTMAPFLRGLICRFLASRISNPGPSVSRTASYTYLQTLDANKKPERQDNREVESSTPKQYNLESIPGL